MAIRKDISTQPVYEFGQMTGKPLEYYSGVFASLDPAEIAERTRVPYDAALKRFTLTLMGAAHTVDWPGAGFGATDPYARILILRYLDEGRFIPPTGKYLAYNELPWGDVYGANFHGRVIRRFVHTFGNDLDTFKSIMEKTPGLEAERVGKCDIGYKFDFMNGLPMEILVWEGDDEFPPAAQMLYDETVAFGYTAEDIAVAGDILINSLKNLRADVIK
jgi:hypothetical protein